MATDLCTRRLTKELRALQKEPLESPKVTVQPNEENLLEMHYVIEGSEQTPYQGGIYWGKLMFPKTYPLKPPGVMMMTPSGRFQPNRRLCLSMSDFHPETWNPMWSVSTILTGLYSFMIESSPTLGSITTTTSQKRQFARQSLEFNCRDATFRKIFPEYAEIYRKQLEERQAVLGISGNEQALSTLSSVDQNVMAAHGDANMQGFFAAAAGIVAVLSAVVFAIMRFI